METKSKGEVKLPLILTNKIIFFLFFLLLCKIILNSIDLTIQSYNKFYEHESNIFENSISSINRIDFFNFWEITGFSTGYGFFAPNVSSNFIIKSEITINQNTFEIINNHSLKTKEGKLRFLMLNQVFMSLIEAKGQPNESTIKEYLKLILSEINQHTKNEFNTSQVITTLYLYDFPSIERISKNDNDIILYKIIEIE